MQETKVLQLFEGMTADQVKEFRRRVVPVLQELRREIVTAESSKPKTSRGKKLCDAQQQQPTVKDAAPVR